MELKRVGGVPGVVQLLGYALLLSSLSGCGTLGYYWQAGAGHLDVMVSARPVAEVLADPSVAEKSKEAIRYAREVRAFASKQLHLPDNESYTTYADLGRPYVVWNVVATPTLSLTPKRWCFAVVGCLAYRGFYDEADARALADELQGANHDVLVGGVRAYSTLGWFTDPLLNTMLSASRLYTAEVIIHELAHQEIYIDDDTAYNEAFATAVADEGLRRWLESRDDNVLSQRARSVQVYRSAFIALVDDYRERLMSLFESDLKDGDKAERKTKLYGALRADYRQVSASWPSPKPYARFFDEDINNARLASVATYYHLVPAFEVMLKDVDMDLKRFYSRAREVGNFEPSDRRETMNAYLARAEQE